ncbi:hypothetical protein QR680_018104 [Steinernema hermaphroditum]|uniref:Uncharacterized protein n=1 Tax=Steinernema hermaphroditum TaxID=289476 RepID=A0AA39HGX1_9BILA|nr:hypothetical protein QR680_018104 [Steinernema hermaphroditum]
MDAGESPPTTSSNAATLHVYFSPSPWESAAASQSVTLAMNPPSSSAHARSAPLNGSANGSIASLHTLMENASNDEDISDAPSFEWTRRELAARLRSELHSDVVDRWIELHFQAPPISACRVRSYIPPMFNIHTRTMSIDRHHRHRQSSRSSLHHGSLVNRSEASRSSGSSFCMRDPERTHALKLKKTTAMKRAPAMGANSSRLSRERRRSTPAFATLGTYVPTSSVSITLAPIPEATEEDERKDSGVVSASGDGSTSGICSSLTDISIKGDAEEMESEKLCDKLCEEMAELPLSDQLSAEKLVMQSFSSLAVSDKSRKIHGV